MTFDSILRGIEIGTEKMVTASEMTRLLSFANTNDNFVQILERVHIELQEGIDEIDQMLSQNTEELI